MTALTLEMFELILEHIRTGLDRGRRVLEEGVGTRDKRLRKLFYEVCKEVLIGNLGMSEESFKEHVYVEGFNKIRDEKPKLFGSKAYPDAVIKLDDGHIIAIELDWGDKGSKLKNALARAGILKLVWKGKYDRIILFFFIHPPQAKQKIPMTDLEQKILKYYEQELSTKLIIL